MREQNIDSVAIIMFNLFKKKYVLFDFKIVD